MTEREKQVYDALSDQCARREYCVSDIRRKALERLEWDAAAAVIVPLVRQVQAANGIEPYTPEQYAGHP